MPAIHLDWSELTPGRGRLAPTPARTGSASVLVSYSAHGLPWGAARQALESRLDKPTLAWREQRSEDAMEHRVVARPAFGFCSDQTGPVAGPRVRPGADPAVAVVWGLATLEEAVLIARDQKTAFKGAGRVAGPSPADASAHLQHGCVSGHYLHRRAAGRCAQAAAGLLPPRRVEEKPGTEPPELAPGGRRAAIFGGPRERRRRVMAPASDQHPLMSCRRGQSLVPFTDLDTARCTLPCLEL